MKASMELVKIGEVHRRSGKTLIEIDQAWREGLVGLEEFSHCHVVWWAHQDVGFDTRAVLCTDLPYAPGHKAGVFACRSPFRPNLIAVTVCPVQKVDRQAGTIEVADIDAIDGTPVIDVKAYYGACDRVREPREPAWLPRWGSWFPDEGMGLRE